MRTKNLFFIFSAIALLAFAGVAQAAWLVDAVDSITPLAGYDIDAAKLEAYPTGDETFPYNGKLGLKMKAANKLPGIILVELDLDSNPATGGGAGMLALPGISSCISNGNNIKTNAGFDIGFYIALRSQHPTASTAVSNPWFNCVQKGTPCTGVGGCSTLNSFQSNDIPCTMGSLIGTRCTAGPKVGNVCVTDDDCGVEENAAWVCNTTAHSGLCYNKTARADACDIDCDNGPLVFDDCFVMTDGTAGTINNKCDVNTPIESLRGGNWAAFVHTAASTTGVQPYFRGTDDNLVKITGAEICITLPMSKIVEYAKTDPTIEYDQILAGDPANWRWSISAWQNNAQDSDDFIIYNDAQARNCTCGVDAVPGANDVVEPVTVLTANYCVADTNGDGKVILGDLVNLKADFGNTKCPCTPKP